MKRKANIPSKTRNGVKPRKSGLPMAFSDLSCHLLQTSGFPWGSLLKCSPEMQYALTKLCKCELDRHYTVISASWEAKAPGFPPSFCLSSVSLQQHRQDSEPTSCCSDWYPRTCFSDKGDKPDWVGGLRITLVDLYSSPKLF